ncbi:hypothetical protein, partial [Xanthomonas albilineans]|uniref:hypothetical protein n=1 Tax=Xanthomonas albilineans TaxID=29447 RepID=UPI001E38FD7A
MKKVVSLHPHGAVALSDRGDHSQSFAGCTVSGRHLLVLFGALAVHPHQIPYIVTNVGRKTTGFHEGIVGVQVQEVRCLLDQFVLGR